MRCFLLAIVILASLTGCAAFNKLTHPNTPVAAEEKTLQLAQVSFGQVAGWQQANMLAGFKALQQSCVKILAQSPSTPMGRNGWTMQAGQWQPMCAAAKNLPASQLKPDQARAFFENYLVPYAANNNAQGLFTGYYLPALKGSRTQAGVYQTPLYARPQDLVEVDLGAFRPELQGQRIAGSVDAMGRLQPYPARAAIEAGALQNRATPILWVDDANQAFMTEVQGSGLVQLDTGEQLMVGFAAQNGHVYHAIGKTLIGMGALTKQNVSLKTILAWLRANPDKAPALRATNPSYVFFKAQPNTQALGAANVGLTPEGSIAVDPRFVPYGTPVFIDATYPSVANPTPARLQKLLVAQDTGGAIRGPVRGDVFWGAGLLAEDYAGHMKSAGTWWLLLPKGALPNSFKVQAP
jgi:membrane-bound lytic murein transglycosylase A